MCVRLYAKPEKIIIFGFFKFCSLSLNVEKSTFCPRNLTGLANSMMWVSMQISDFIKFDTCNNFHYNNKAQLQMLFFDYKVYLSY